MNLLNAHVDLYYIVKFWFVIFINIFSFFAGKDLKTKWQSLRQLLALEERKIEQLEKAVQQKSIMSTREDEHYHFLMSFVASS